MPMTDKGFDRLVDTVTEHIQTVLKSGAEEYASDSNRLSNFENIARELDVSPSMVCFIFLKKHIDGIAAFVRTGKPQRDSINGRITDAINYLILLQAIFESTGADAKINDGIFDDDRRDEDRRAPHDRREPSGGTTGSVTMTGTPYNANKPFYESSEIPADKRPQ